MTTMCAFPTDETCGSMPRPMRLGANARGQPRVVWPGELVLTTA